MKHCLVSENRAKEDRGMYLKSIEVYGFKSFANKITFVDENNKLTAYSTGTYEFKKEYQYISVFACTKSEISWKNTKYLLDHQILNTNDLFGLSNEIELEPAILTVHSGKVLVVDSNDKKRFPN